MSPDPCRGRHNESLFLPEMRFSSLISSVARQHISHLYLVNILSSVHFDIHVQGYCCVRVFMSVQQLRSYGDGPRFKVSSETLSCIGGSNLHDVMD